MGAVVLGLALAGVALMAIWGSATKKATRPAPPPETKEEQGKREREEQHQQRRRSDIAKFMADPRFLK
ncbi:MAG TPA: hypothetical protein VGR61_07610 [Candidatus Dormibacteraeota bacterium]|nr:hypothetical protein [Candidatus Dormibacteraeota bacterium]